MVRYIFAAFFSLSKKVLKIKEVFFPSPDQPAFLPIFNAAASKRAMTNVWPSFSRAAHKLVMTYPTTQVVTKTFQFFRFPLVDNLFSSEFSQSGHAPVTFEGKISPLASIDDSISFACDFHRVVDDEVWLFNITVPSRICVFGGNHSRVYFKFAGSGKYSRVMIPYSANQTRFQFKFNFESITPDRDHELFSSKICVNIVLDHLMIEDSWVCNINLLPA